MTTTVLRILLVATLVLVALPGTAAADCTDSAGELTGEELQAIADTYNQNVDDLPGFLTGQIAGERVEFRVTGETELVYTMVFDENARAIGVSEGSDEPTLRITVAGETLCDSLQSDNPGAALAGAYQSGDVAVEGVGTANALKVTVLKTAISIAQFFGVF